MMYMSKILPILVVFTTLIYSSAGSIKRIEKMLGTLGEDGMQCENVANLMKSFSDMVGTAMDATGVMKGAFSDFKDDMVDAMNNPDMQAKIKGVQSGFNDIISQLSDFEGNGGAIINAMQNGGFGDMMNGVMGNIKGMADGISDLKGSMKSSFGPPIMNMVGTGYSLLDNMASGGLMNNFQDIANNAMAVGNNMLSMDGFGDFTNEMMGDFGDALGGIMPGGLGSIGGGLGGLGSGLGGAGNGLGGAGGGLGGGGGSISSGGGGSIF